MNSKFRFLIVFVLLISMQGISCFAKSSSCLKFEDVSGSGLYPFNLRMIDRTFFAGGFLFNPVTKANSDEKVEEFLHKLKEFGVSNIILLHVPSKKTRFQKVLDKKCQDLALKLIECRMNSVTVPTQTQTKIIFKAIGEGAYVHCMWGCDRTGAIIGKYLTEKKGFSGLKAWKAIIKNGTHAGKMGGFKKIPGNRNLLLYFWPEAKKEAPEVFSFYN